MALDFSSKERVAYGGTRRETNAGAAAARVATGVMDAGRRALLGRLYVGRTRRVEQRDWVDDLLQD